MGLVSAVQAAARLGLSTERVYREVKAGRLPGAVRIGPKSLRFDLEALDAFIRSGGRHPDPRPPRGNGEASSGG